LAARIKQMTRLSFATRSSRWLFRAAWIVQSNLVRLMGRFRVLADCLKIRLDKEDRKLRGPIFWLGDLRKDRGHDDSS
jgi:hypothetical protein